MTESEFIALLDRYEKGKCTAEEKELIEKWLDSSNDKAQTPFATEEEKAGVQHALQASIRRSIRGNLQRSPPFLPGVGVRIAASILLVALALSGVYYSIYGPQHNKIVVNNSAPDADHKIIKLPDGSSVFLRSGSVLNYPKVFGKTREVKLEGEGFFDIKHDPTRPFVVSSGNLTTTVLGTAFNIRALPNDDHIVVTVTRGRVQVQDGERILGVIAADEQITFNVKELEADVEKVESREVVAWMDKDIYFDDITMEEAIARLEERFGATIEIASDKVKTCQFTATFVRGETLDEVLEVICEFNNAVYKKDESGTITITGDGCELK